MPKSHQHRKRRSSKLHGRKKAHSSSNSSLHSQRLSASEKEIYSPIGIRLVRGVSDATCRIVQLALGSMIDGAAYVTNGILAPLRWGGRVITRPYFAGKRLYSLIQLGRALENRSGPAPRPSLAVQLEQTELDERARDLIASLERRIRKLEFSQARMSRRMRESIPSTPAGNNSAGIATPVLQRTPAAAIPNAPPPPPMCPPPPTPVLLPRAFASRPVSSGNLLSGQSKPAAGINIADIARAQQGLRAAPKRSVAAHQTQPAPLITIQSLAGVHLRKVARRSPRLVDRTNIVGQLGNPDLRQSLRKVEHERSPGGTPHREKPKNVLTPLHRAVQAKFKAAGSENVMP